MENSIKFFILNSFFDALSIIVNTTSSILYVIKYKDVRYATWSFNDPVKARMARTQLFVVYKLALVLATFYKSDIDEIVDELMRTRRVMSENEIVALKAMSEAFLKLAILGPMSKEEAYSKLYADLYKYEACRKFLKEFLMG